MKKGSTRLTVIIDKKLKADVSAVAKSLKKSQSQLVEEWIELIIEGLKAANEPVEKNSYSVQEETLVSTKS